MVRPQESHCIDLDIAVTMQAHSMVLYIALCEMIASITSAYILSRITLEVG